MLLKKSVCGRIFLFINFLMLVAGANCSAFEILKPTQYQIWGYYPYWIKGEWRKIDLALYDQLLFFEIPVHAGKIFLHSNGWPGNWKKLIAAAKKNGTRLQPTFTLFDAKEFEQIFSDKNQRKMLQAEMMALLDQADSSGLQLDFEIFDPVSVASVAGYRQFLSALKGELVSRQKALSLFVLSEDSAGLNDKNSLRAADFIVIQGYDAHWKESLKAGPVSQLHGRMAVSWESSLNHYLALDVPRNKILMSVPYFGYEWPTATEAVGALTRGVGSEISFAPLPANLVPEVKASALERIRQYGRKRDTTTGSPYYIFRDGTGWFQGWFEDKASLSAKFEFIKKQKLAGIAVFPLGYDGGNFQHLLRHYFRSPDSLPSFSKPSHSDNAQAPGR